MRIAYLSAFYPYRGGIAQFNGALYRELEKISDIKAYTFKRQYPELLFPGKTQFVTENDKADKIPADRVLDTINPFNYMASANKILSQNPDLFLTKFWIPFTAPSFGYIASRTRKAGKTNIAILGNVIPHERRPLDVALTKYFFKQNHGFIVMSEDSKNVLHELMPGVPAIVFKHPIYSHFGEKIKKGTAREMLGVPKDKKVLLFFGFIREYKGLDILLESMQYLDDSYHVLVGGESYGSMEKYDEIIKKYNLSGKVTLHNRYIPDDEVPVFYSASDICTLPYRTATISGIVGVAYHFDIPVVATDVGGLREMIEPYSGGIVVNEPDPKLLSGAFIDIFEGGADYKKNIQKYKTDYSWEKYAQTVIEFKESLK